MYFEMGAKVEEGRPVTVELKAWGDAPDREKFEAYVADGLETILLRLLAARCVDHGDEPTPSKLPDQL